MKAILAGAWLYRFFIFSSIKTELRLKFVRSHLGGLWMILNPLANVLIFTFILSNVLSSKLPGVSTQYAYSIYLMAGTVCWSLFSEIVNRCLTLFIDHGNLMKKITFPKIALPLIVTGSASVNNALLLLAVLVIGLFLGHWPGLALIWIPVLMAATIVLALGVGVAMGVLNVFVRDIGQIVPVVMSFLFWFTPIVYMIDIIPHEYRKWLELSPMVPLVVGYQDVLLRGQAPSLGGIAAVFLVAGVFVALALLLFRKASAEMVDYL